MKSKKFRNVTALALALIVACGALAGCSGNTGKQPDNQKPPVSTEGQNNTKPDQGQDSQSGSAATEESALKLLENVWAAHSDDQKFAVMGGDAAAGITDNAGSFSLKDASAVDSMLGVPEASVSDISEAASLIHMMNANTFTGAAFKTADSKTANELAGKIEKHLSERQWMCGIPEKLYIAVTQDGFVISAFGAADIMNVFTEKLSGSYKIDVVTEKNLG